MSRMYLDVDSTFRNRNDSSVSGQATSSICNFNIPVSKSGQMSFSNALDPLLAEAPLVIVEGIVAGGGALTAGFSGTLVVTGTDGGAMSEALRILVRTTGNDFTSSVVGASVRVDNGGVIEARRVVDQAFVRDKDSILTLESPLTSATFVHGATVTVAMNFSRRSFFVSGGSSINGYYVGCFADFVDEDVGILDSKKIVYYDGRSKIAILESDVASATVTNTNSIHVRRKAVSTAGAYAVDVSSRSTSSLFLADSVTSSLIGKYLSLTATGKSHTIHRVLRSFFNASVAVVSYSDPTLTVSGVEDESLVGMFVKSGGEYIRVTAQSGNTLTMADTFTVAPLGTVQIQGVVIEGNTDTLDAGYYEIQEFVKDNASFYTFQDSTRATRSNVPYSVKLIHLLFPTKRFLQGIVNEYSHLYVELRQNNNSSTEKISSNNPNVRKALFVVSIEDNDRDKNTNFVQIRGGEMTQNLNFSPGSDMSLVVRLPNGDIPIFRSEVGFSNTVSSDGEIGYVQEFSSYKEPNPDLQIKALFEFVRQEQSHSVHGGYSGFR